MKIVNNVSNLIGETPIVKLNNQATDNAADIYVKLEYFNPGSSVKDRIAKAMIEQAEIDGDLQAGGTIVEPTSGNTGIGLAMVAAAKGYKLIVTMPDTMSKERRNLLSAYGAEIVLTPGSKGMKGAIEKANELVTEHNYYMPQQFNNEANPHVHAVTTGKEILTQIPDGLDAFISGVGTGGTITGVGRVLKDAYPNIKIYTIEPKDSPVLSGGSPGQHKIQGIGAGFVAGVIDEEAYDEFMQVTNEEAYGAARQTAKREGILGGVSSGAAISAAIKVANKLGKGKKVLAILPDNGERYLSTPLYEEEE